jgi:hypothetical protein
MISAASACAFGRGLGTLAIVPGAAGEATEAIQGPVYSLWVVWTAVLGAVLLRRRRIARPLQSNADSRESHDHEP